MGTLFYLKQMLISDNNENNHISSKTVSPLPCKNHSLSDTVIHVVYICILLLCIEPHYYMIQ
jgi:hypothetical protein